MKTSTFYSICAVLGFIIFVSALLYGTFLLADFVQNFIPEIAHCQEWLVSRMGR